jgi:regulatory protein
MTSKHDAARAALEAALAATSPTSPTSSPSSPSSPSASRGRRAGGGRPRPEAWQPIPGDPEADSTTRDEEPDAYDVARQIVLRQLALSPRSRKQLRDKLRERNCPDDVAEAVLDRMGEVGLVDDEAYAGMLVRSQQASRGLARRALARELRTKGVDDETARATLEALDPAAERERAERLVAKRLRTLHGLDATVQTRRLAGMLARKGYPADLAMAVVREAVAGAPEHQRD